MNNHNDDIQRIVAYIISLEETRHSIYQKTKCECKTGNNFQNDDDTARIIAYMNHMQSNFGSVYDFEKSNENLIFNSLDSDHIDLNRFEFIDKKLSLQLIRYVFTGSRFSCKEKKEEVGV